MIVPDNVWHSDSKEPLGDVSAVRPGARPLQPCHKHAGVTQRRTCVTGNQRFEAVYCIHLQGSKNVGIFLALDFKSQDIHQIFPFSTDTTIPQTVGGRSPSDPKSYPSRKEPSRWDCDYYKHRQPKQVTPLWRHPVLW